MSVLPVAHAYGEIAAVEQVSSVLAELRLGWVEAERTLASERVPAITLRGAIV